MEIISEFGIRNDLGKEILWTYVGNTLLRALDYAEQGEKIIENSSNRIYAEIFYIGLENIDSNQDLFVNPLINDHTITEKISTKDLSLKLSEYIGSLQKKHFNGDDSKLIKLLKECSINILEDPEKRKEFGFEARVYKNVAEYFVLFQHNPMSWF